MRYVKNNYKEYKNIIFIELKVNVFTIIAISWLACSQTEAFGRFRRKERKKKQKNGVNVLSDFF